MKNSTTELQKHIRRNKIVLKMRHVKHIRTFDL